MRKERDKELLEKKRLIEERDHACRHNAETSEAYLEEHTERVRLAEELGYLREAVLKADSLAVRVPNKMLTCPMVKMHGVDWGNVMKLTEEPQSGDCGRSPLLSERSEEQSEHGGDGGNSLPSECNEDKKPEVSG